MRKKLDLTGQRFGSLTVLRPSENIGGRTAWVCRCDCGQETIVRTNNLRSGRTRGCGSHPNTATARKVKAARRERKNTKSGVSGVDWQPRTQRWRATISFQGKRYYLGTYQEFENAVKARKQAEKMRMQAEKDLRANFLCAFSSK